MAFEQDAEVVDLLDIIRVELGHGESAPRQRGHEPLVLERPERFAHRDAARPEELRQLLLSEPRARRERGGQYRFAHRAQHQVLSGQLPCGIGRDDLIELGLA